MGRLVSVCLLYLPPTRCDIVTAVVSLVGREASWPSAVTAISLGLREPRSAASRRPKAESDAAASVEAELNQDHGSVIVSRHLRAVERETAGEGL